MTDCHASPSDQFHMCLPGDWGIALWPGEVLFGQAMSSLSLAFFFIWDLIMSHWDYMSMNALTDDPFGSQI